MTKEEIKQQIKSTALNKIRKPNEKRLKIKKGQESNWLSILRDLSKGWDGLFEEVKEENTDGFSMLFDTGKKIVSKQDFTVTLTVEFNNKVDGSVEVID